MSLLLPYFLLLLAKCIISKHSMSIAIEECFASRTHSGGLTSYEKPVGRPRGWMSCAKMKRPVVTLFLSSLKLFANYKRLAVESLIYFVNERNEVREAWRGQFETINHNATTFAGNCVLRNLVYTLSHLQLEVAANRM